MNEPLHRPDLLQRSRAGRENAPEYLAYLQSSEWRRRRNRALTRAGYRCERCSGRRRLQVHHLTYERLGTEWDQDLEVLCETCHQGEHFSEPDQTGLGVYLRLASAAVEADPFGDIGELSEQIKRQCVSLRIPVNASRIADALGVCGLRLKTRPPMRVVHERPMIVPPMSHQAARELLCRLSVAMNGTPTAIVESVLHTMPAVEKTAAEQRAHEDRLTAQIQQFKDVPAVPRVGRREA